MLTPWVIIPTYNERQNITRMIEALYRLQIPTLSVLVVDDNSPDGTAAAVEELRSRFSTLFLLRRPGKQGLGPAYIAGFDFALQHGADALVQMDADFSHDPADVPRLLAKLQTYDAVLGSRYSHGISVINWPLRRLLISVAGNLYARVITGLPFRDVTGGFRAWKAEALRSIHFNSIKADGYGFQIFIIYKAWALHKKIIEMPIIFTERREGQSKMTNTIIWEALWLVWRVRFGR